MKDKLTVEDKLGPRYVFGKVLETVLSDKELDDWLECRDALIKCGDKYGASVERANMIVNDVLDVIEPLLCTFLLNRKIENQKEVNSKLIF